VPTDLTAIRAEFPGLARWAYLDFAGVALVSSRAVRALSAYGQRSAQQGGVDTDAAETMVEDVRVKAAHLLGATPAEVCFVRNTTEGLGWVANGLDLRPGDRVIVTGGEFPSNWYPWVTLAERGIQVDVVEADPPGVPLERFAAALSATPPARLLVTSWVRYDTGWRADLASVGKLCHDAGTLFCVDAIQGLGVIPADFGALPVDFAVADGHKWICGLEGQGVMYVAADCIDVLRPLEPGWNSVVHRREWTNLVWDPDPSARRFEGGSHATAMIAALGAALDILLDCGSESVWRRVEQLVDYAAAKLDDAGMHILTERKSAHDSGILTFKHPKLEPEEVKAAALEHDVVVSAPRGGGVRVSPHAWCEEEDIDRLVAAVGHSAC
jgi:cysteine desulfurase/selenocysteine lyase